MNLKEKLQEDLTRGLKSRNELLVTTVRSALGAIGTAEKSGKAAVEFDDAAVEKLIRQQVKQRKDSSKIYESAGEIERAGREYAEAKLLESYLPKMLSEAELREIVLVEMAGLSDSSPASFGLAMKAVMAKAGNSADGALVSKLVRDELR